MLRDWKLIEYIVLCMSIIAALFFAKPWAPLVSGADLKRARPRVLHVLEPGRHNDAIMVAAIARPDADQLVGLRVDKGNSAGQPLKSAEHADDVFAVIGDGQSLHVRSDTLDLLLDRPGVGVDHHHAAGGRRGVTDRQIEFRAVKGKHHVEWIWIFAAPKRILDVGDLSPIARVGIAGIENGAMVLG